MSAGLGVVLSFLYLVAMIAVGFAVSRWSKSGSDFLIGGRQVGLFVFVSGTAAMQLAGTTVSGYPGDAYQFGWGAMWGAWGWAIGAWLLALLVARFANRSGAYTSVEWLGGYFGPATRWVASVGGVIALLFGTMAQFVGAGNILSGWTGWPYQYSVVLIGLSCVIYMYAGGYWATLITDMLQFFIAIVAIYFLLPVFLLRNFGGLEFLTSGPNPVSGDLLRLPFGSLRLSGMLLPSIFGYIWLSTAFILAGPQFWQRATSGRTEKTSWLGYMLAGLVVLPFGITTAMSGIYIRALKGPGLVPAKVFGVLLGEMPVYLAAIFMMGVLAATQSTADQNIMGAAAVLTRDVLGRLMVLKPQQELLYGRIATLAIGIMATLLAITYSYGALFALALMSAFVASLIPPLLASIYWRGCTKEGATLAIGVSVVVGLYWGVFTDLWKTVMHVMYVVPLVSAAILVIVSWVVKLTGPWWRSGVSIEVSGGQFHYRSHSVSLTAYQALFYNLAKPIIRFPRIERYLIEIGRRKGNPWVEAFEEVQ